MIRIDERLSIKVYLSRNWEFDSALHYTGFQSIRGTGWSLRIRRQVRCEGGAQELSDDRRAGIGRFLEADELQNMT